MGILQKVGGFLGINKFGQGLAATGRVLSGEVNKDIQTQNQTSSDIQKLNYVARQETDPIKKQRLLKMAQGFGTGTSAEEIDPNLNLKPKEILGSAANVVLNITGLSKVGNATKGFKLAKAAVPTAQTALKTVAKSTAQGAAFGAASGLEKNRSASGIAGSTAGGALIGGAIGGLSVGAKVLKDFVTKTTPEWLMNNAVKPTLDEARKTIKYGNDTLGKELLEEGVHGKPEKLLQIANQKLGSLEDDLQNVLNNAHLGGATIERKNLTSFVRDIVTEQKKIPGSGGNVQRIKDVFKSIPEKMTLQQANEMKRAIYQELRSPAYKLDAKLSAKAGTLKAIAKGLKTEIENQVGGSVVKDINRKLAMYGRLENRIVDQLARAMKNNGFGLTDAILASGGIASMNPLGMLASLGGIGLRHGGSALETGAAVGLNKLQNIGTGATAQAEKELLKRGVMNLP